MYKLLCSPTSMTLFICRNVTSSLKEKVNSAAVDSTNIKKTSPCVPHSFHSFTAPIVDETGQVDTTKKEMIMGRPDTAP